MDFKRLYSIILEHSDEFYDWVVVNNKRAEYGRCLDYLLDDTRDQGDREKAAEFVVSISLEYNIFFGVTKKVLTLIRDKNISKKRLAEELDISRPTLDSRLSGKSKWKTLEANYIKYLNLII